MLYSIGRIALILVTAVMLSGCSYVLMKQVEEHSWTEEKMLRDGWLPTRVVSVEPIYCYSTIGEPECYREAQPEIRNLLVGSFAAPKAFWGFPGAGRRMAIRGPVG